MPPVKGFDAQPAVLAGLKISKHLPMDDADHEDFIKELSHTIIEWAEKQESASLIKRFATPWETEAQTTHLAALAYVGDFNTLMDYQQMFKRGKRANFHPYVKADAIDRALDIALERA